MTLGFSCRASLLLLSCFMLVGTVEAKDCPRLNPNRERAALNSFYKANGYTAKQITFSMAYADSKALDWEEIRPNERGRACGLGIIQAMIYSCIVGRLPEVVTPNDPGLSKPIQDKAFLKMLGVKQLTVGESLAVGISSSCQAGAIQAFAKR